MESPAPANRQSSRLTPSTHHPHHARLTADSIARAQEDSNYEGKKDVIYNVQVLYKDRVRRWSRHI